MKSTCLMVCGKTQNDARFRPGSATPDKHWAYLLLDSFSEYDPRTQKINYPEGIRIHWGGDKQEGISVQITSDLWKNNEACFEYLMNFIKTNDLTYEFPCNMEQCTTCEGHPSCVVNEHNVTVASVDAVECETCPRAA